MPAISTHEYVSTKADPADATLVGKTKWNANHIVSLSVLPAELDLASLTASKPLGTDGSKLLVSLAVNGTGAVVLATGNAGSATVLQTARNINGVAFDGSANVTVPAAGSTLTDTVTVAKGGTGLTSLGTALHLLRVNAAGTALEFAAAGGGSGDVVGPASATDGVPALFDGTTGKLLKNSTPTGTGAVVRGTSPTITTSLLFANGQGFFDSAADITELRRGLNVQTFRVFGSYIDPTNYHLAEIRWSGTDLFIGTNRAGGGSNGQLQLRGHDGIIFHTGGTIAERWWITPGGVFHPNANNTYDIGLDAVRVRTLYLSTSLVNAGYIEMTEMVAPAAPAANTGRLFFQDNGSGKTQFMVLFPSGVAQEIKIEA